MTGAVAVAILPAGHAGQQQLRHLRVKSGQTLEHQLPGLLLQRITYSAARLQLPEHGDTASGVDQINVLIRPQ